jgi:hypothetical protein
MTTPISFHTNNTGDYLDTSQESVNQLEDRQLTVIFNNMELIRICEKSRVFHGVRITSKASWTRRPQDMTVELTPVGSDEKWNAQNQTSHLQNP